MFLMLLQWLERWAKIRLGEGVDTDFCGVKWFVV